MSVVEVAATYACTECGERVFSVATSRGDALSCGCADEDGTLELVWNIDHNEFPEKWEFNETEFTEVLDR